VPRFSTVGYAARADVHNPIDEQQLLLRVVRCLPPNTGLSVYTTVQRAGV
jgi:hypothetical protein